MKDLLNFINESKDLGIINNTKDKIMVWGLSSSEISFHISISNTNEPPVQVLWSNIHWM